MSLQAFVKHAKLSDVVGKFVGHTFFTIESQDLLISCC